MHDAAAVRRHPSQVIFSLAFRAANREFVYTGKDIMISYTESFAKFQENEANLRPPIVYSDAINHRFR